MNLANDMMSVVLKATLVVMLIGASVAGVETYAKWGHTGPACVASSFNQWIPDKGDVVSIHEAKLQPTKGRTKCYGVFKTTLGVYEGWAGTVTELTDGIVIGTAQLD